MERITISIDGDLAIAFDALIAERGYRNRSEAMRDLLRAELELERDRGGRDDGTCCIAALSHVHNHHERALVVRGVRHGSLNLTSADVARGGHTHGNATAYCHGGAGPHVPYRPCG